MARLSLFAALAAGLLFAGAANAKTYSCTVTPDNSRHWIAKTLLINIDERSGEIRVFDNIIKGNQAKPIAGELSAETGKRITLKWTVHQVRDDYSNNTARFLFRASFFKATGKVIVSSIPGGWDNMFGGRGRCTVSDDKSWARIVANTPVAEFSPRGKAQFFMAGERVLLLP